MWYLSPKAKELLSSFFQFSKVGAADPCIAAGQRRVMSGTGRAPALRAPGWSLGAKAFLGKVSRTLSEMLPNLKARGVLQWAYLPGTGCSAGWRVWKVNKEGGPAGKWRHPPQAPSQGTSAHRPPCYLEATDLPITFSWFVPWSSLQAHSFLLDTGLLTREEKVSGWIWGHPDMSKFYLEAHFSILALTALVIFELCLGGGWFCKLSCEALEGKGAARI